MRESTVNLMLRLLTRHFNEPVKPVSKYCESLKTWARIIEEKNADGDTEKHRQGSEYAKHLRHILIDIAKSNLLARLIYGNEKLRTRECPIHKGKWSGIMECPEGCDMTGWLPEPEDVKAPAKEVSVIEVVETNAVITPSDMRRWLDKLGWIQKTSHNPRIALWEKAVRDRGSVERVILSFPTADDDPNWPRHVEDAAYTVWEKFGTSPRRFLVEVFEGGQGSHVTMNT